MACTPTNTETETPTLERPLSPILSNKLHRKYLHGVRRKLGKTHGNQTTSKIEQMRREILECTDFTQRLQKIKQYVDEKRRLNNYFYNTDTEDTLQSEFDFKKPIPVKEFRRKSIEHLNVPSDEHEIAVNFYDSGAPTEGEKPTVINSSLEREIFELEQALLISKKQCPDAVVDPSKHIVNTIKSENRQLEVISGLEKVFIGFEDIEIKLATKLFNKLTEAHQLKTFKTSVSNSKCFCLDKMEEVELVNSRNDCRSLNDVRLPNPTLPCSTPSISVLNNALVSTSSNSNALVVQDFGKGFSTASGKCIDISEAAFSNARKLFADDSNTSITFTKPGRLECDRSISSPGRQHIKIPDDIVFLKDPEINGCTSSFSTAGGKNIAISNESLLNANRLFSDDVCGVPELDTQLNKISSSLNFQNFSVAGLAQEVVCNAKSTSLTSSLPSSVDCTIGFTTASNKNIQINEKAVVDAEARFLQDFGNSQKRNRSEVEAFGGFSTVSNKTIGISNDLISKAKNFFSEDFNDLSSTKFELKSIVTPCSTNGFATASGSKIVISNEALHNANKMFNEDGSSLECESIKTSNGSDSKSNKPGLTLAQNVPVVGFATAHGRNIEISENAFNKAKILFENVEKNTESMKLDENKGNRSDTITFDLEMDQTTITEPSFNMQSTVVDDSKATPKRGRKRLGVSRCKQIPIASEKLQKAHLVFNDCVESVTPNKNNQTNLYNSTPVKVAHSKSWTDFNSMSPVAKKPRFCSDSLLLEKHSMSAVTPFILQQQTGDTSKRLEDLNEYCSNLESKLLIAQERKHALMEQIRIIESADDFHKRQRPGILLQKKRANQLHTLKSMVFNSVPLLCHQLTKVSPQNALHVHFNDTSFKDAVVVRTEDGACVIPNTSNLIGLAEIKSAFSAMPGVDPKLIPTKWIENHFKWIVWKLVSYERGFSNLSGCLTVENVIQQLKYRYDREIDLAQRSALHRILEKDDVPQKRMILCVSDIYKAGDGYELELCDGWYSIRTIIDQPLCFEVSREKIVIGTKLIIQYAEVLDCDGCHPLEVTDFVRLKINYNCTRRAAWFAKLGYQQNSKPFPISLATIKPDGGLIGCINVYIARVYPLRFMEKQSNGRVIWRNQKAEERYIQHWENQQMKDAELISNKISNDYEMLTKDDDSHELQSTQAVHTRLEQHSELSLRLAQEMSKLKKLSRDVIPTLKCRVVDCTHNDARGFIFNIWNANEEHTSSLKEGRCVSIRGVVPRRNGELTSTARTYFTKLPVTSNAKMQRQLLPIAMLQESFMKPVFNEFDTVGTIVRFNNDTHHQELWLCDFMRRLLLIRVREGRHTCSLFDSISIGQHVSVANLIFCKPQETFATAIATQCSIVTCYPSQAFLQESLIKYREQLPEDISVLLKECTLKIDSLQASIQPMLESSNISHVLNDTLEDSTEIPSRLTSLDIAMSLIDTDQYA